MDQVARHVADTATEILVRDGVVAPMAFSLRDSDDGIDLVIVPVLDYETQEEKERSFAISLGYARAFGSKRLLIVVDTWFAILDPDEVGADGDFGLAPSQRLDRREGLMITDCTELGVRAYMLNYSRDEEGNPVPEGEWTETPGQLDGMVVRVMTAMRDMADPPDEVRAELEELAEKLGISHTL